MKTEWTWNRTYKNLFDTAKALIKEDEGNSTTQLIQNKFVTETTAGQR